VNYNFIVIIKCAKMTFEIILIAYAIIV